MSQVDLRQLSLRGERPGAPVVHRPRNWVSRYMLPAVVLLGFTGLLAFAARDTWLPARQVTVVSGRHSSST